MSTPPTALSFQPLSRILRSARYVFGVLFVATVALLAWQHYGMERTVELLDGKHQVYADDDRGGGGKSVGVLERRPHELVVRCTITRPSSNPYCKLGIITRSEAGGIDMSGFSHFTIDMAYEGPGPNRTDIALVNDEAGLTQADRWETYKVNQVVYVGIPQHGLMTVPLRWFGVAQWWTDLVKPPLEHSYVRIDNVARIELTSPGEANAGVHVMHVRSVKLHGKIVTQSHLLLILISVWIACTVGLLLSTTLMLRSQLRQSDNALSLLTQVNRALELEARELAGQAYFDPLTGVLNRQGLRAALMNTSTLMAAPMSVIFIDIDHFKHINDTHGHATGDDVLRRFAQVLGAGIRTSDRLVRWGGEEFLIICPLTDVHQAVRVAEALRTRLHGQSWPLELAVTASFGVAQHVDQQDIGVVIKQADDALYSAKAAGRDRVHAHGVGRAAQVA